MKTLLKSLSCALAPILFVPAVSSADVPVELNCSNASQEVLLVNISLMRGPDPATSDFVGGIQRLSVNSAQKGQNLEWDQYIDSKFSKNLFWFGESQDFFEITNRDKSRELSPIKSVLIVLEKSVLSEIYNSQGNVKTGLGPEKSRTLLTRAFVKVTAPGPEGGAPKIHKLFLCEVVY